MYTFKDSTVAIAVLLIIMTLAGVFFLGTYFGIQRGEAWGYKKCLVDIGGQHTKSLEGK